MAKLFVVQNSDSNMTIVSEWNDNPNGAKQAFHNTCKNLWADANTQKATVKILDEQLDNYEGYRESIIKAQEQAEEPTAKRSTKSTKYF